MIDGSRERLAVRTRRSKLRTLKPMILSTKDLKTRMMTLISTTGMVSAAKEISQARMMTITTMTTEITMMTIKMVVL